VGKTFIGPVAHGGGSWEGKVNASSGKERKGKKHSCHDDGPKTDKFLKKARVRKKGWAINTWRDGDRAGGASSILDQVHQGENI